MIKTDFLDQLNKFRLIVQKRVTSNYAGPKRSIAFGRGVTFKDHRIYAPGDDIRAIDWNVYARTDDLYIKTYEEERNLTTHIILDYSASMDYGKLITKFDYGAMVGVGFAYLTLKDNERFQFSTFSDVLNVFQPRRGMSQLASMVHHINSLKAKGISNVKDTMHQYKKFIRSRSLIVLISDFLIDIEQIKEALYSIGDHEVKIIHVLDPVEKELRLEGDMKLKDSESGKIIRTFVDSKMRQEYQNMMDEHTYKIKDACSRLGFGYNLVTTNTPIFDAFYKILE